MIKERTIFIGICFLFFLQLIILAFQFPSENAYQLGIRVTGLVGFASLFASVIFSDFFIEIDECGKKKLLYHHLFSIIGIILITLHPILLAIDKADFSIFFPKFDSWVVFWELAGRPSLILIYIGFVSGVLIRLYKKSYKMVHVIVYIALFFGLVHGYLIGTDFHNPFVTIVFVLLFLISMYIFIDKRLYQMNTLK